MPLTSLSLLLACVAAAPLASAEGIPGMAYPVIPRQDSVSISASAATSGATPYEFDINSGLYLQTQMSGEAAPELEYTTENGAPYTNPYDAWRIGSTGR